ncbi:uncharacterized protein LOC107460624 isoform X1 [Arachis duranensis]|uniref:Uncharacterized protein LOC107460624 isoform X1 n=2 Tax=Arachis duranensis TaxID=130453 RepID=A0A6P5MNB1_ARADU|nr:uncharacterized protein LOC107460624 isoform X1 [Arachis duranensis]XP_020984348.1 uncharacterized protein LOC107460624 isoform X1 [Arachis duranensis]
MEIGTKKMKVDKEMLNLNDVVSIVSKNCRCNELEERSKKAEGRCAELEFELQRKHSQCEALEAKLKALGADKFAAEEELKVLTVSSEKHKEEKQISYEKERGEATIDSLTDDNEVVQLMIENKVLECEKKRAESEAEVWKDNYKKMELRAIQLELGRGHERNEKQEASNWTTATVGSHQGPISNSRFHPARQARKQLKFLNEESPCKRMAPSTPLGAKPASVCVIDITDSDDEPNIIQTSPVLTQGGGNISVPTCFVAEIEKMSNIDGGNNEKDLSAGEDVPFVATLKRKRTCNVVTSESEHDDANDCDDDDDDDDDDMPISKLKRMHIPKAGSEQVKCDINSSATTTTFAYNKTIGTATPRRRLVPLRKCAREQECKKSSNRSKKAKHRESIATNSCESEEDLSDSEDEGLSDFIVDDSDVSNCDDASSKSHTVSNDDGDSDTSNSQDVPDDDSCSDSQEETDRKVDFGMILSQIQRRKDHKSKWEYEADMLAAFGKDPELCMKAVCALYLQQTSEEQMSRGSMYSNQRGFSKFDAHRGSTLAEFLTNGDPLGGLKKSVKELKEYDPQAVELCRTLANRYSRQLYEIYKNKECPFFS